MGLKSPNYEGVNFRDKKQSEKASQLLFKVQDFHPDNAP